MNQYNSNHSLHKEFQRQRSTSCLRANINTQYNFPYQKYHFSLKKKCPDQIQYPFKPQIHQIPQQLYQRTRKTECSKEDILQRLIHNKNSKISQYQRQKMDEEEQKVKNICTFKPKISQKSKKIAEQCIQSKSAVQRLYTNAVEKIKSKDAIDTSILENNKQNFPFQPKVNPYPFLNAEKRDLRPLHERIKKIIEQKHKNLKDLRDRDFEEKTQKFINEKTNQILLNKKDFKKNVLQRFQQYLFDKKKKSQAKHWEAQRKNTQICTFMPNIGTNIYGKEQSSFISRQQDFAQSLRQKLDYKIQSMLSQKFKPQINKVSELLVKADRQNETQSQKIERWMVQPMLQKQRKIQKTAEQAYRECTFQPQINVISKLLKARHVNHVCKCEPQQQHHEFKPKINQNSTQLAEKHRKGNCHLAKSNITQKIKMDNQYKQLRECTFKPSINKGSRAKSGSLSNIRGLDILNRKMQMIKNKKQYQEKVRQKVFNLQKRYQARKKTQVEQFKLSQGYNNIEKAKKQQAQKFEQQCTFKPFVNHLR